MLQRECSRAVSSLIEWIKESCSRLEGEVEGVTTGCVHIGGIRVELLPPVEDKGETGEAAGEAGN